MYSPRRNVRFIPGRVGPRGFPSVIPNPPRRLINPPRNPQRGSFVSRRRLPPQPRRFLPSRTIPSSRRNPNIPNTYLGRVSGRNIIRTNRGNRIDPRRDTQKLEKREKWFDVIPGTNKYIFKPGEAGIPHLDNLASIYENYQLRHFTIEYMPSSGTTNNGSVEMGVDYAPENDRPTKGIPLLEPNAVGTVYTRHTMTVVINRAMKGATWLSTTAAGTNDSKDKAFALYINAPEDLTTIGQIWVSYSIAFSTATFARNGPSAKPIPISTISTTLVSDVAITPPLDITTNTEKENTVEPVDKMEVSNWDSTDGTEYQNSFEWDNSYLDVGSTFTVGAMTTTPEEISAARSSVRRTPKITFMYSDGTTIEPGSIVPLAQSPSVLLSSNSSKEYFQEKSDIFATLFSIAKPLLKPIWAIVQELVTPIVENYSPSVQFNEPEDFNTLPPEDYTVFTFGGDEALIQIPQNDKLPVSLRQPLTLLVSGGRGWASGQEAGFIEYYDYQFYNSQKEIYTILEQGSGSSAELLITFGVNMPTRDLLYQNGDLITFHVNSFSMDKGIGTSVKTPYISAITATQIDEIFSSLQNSTLSNEVSTLDPTAPKLSITQFFNNTTDDHGKDNVGLFVTGRFIKPENINAYQYVVLKVKIGSITASVPDDVLAGDSSHGKPGYVNALSMLTIQTFPTAPFKPLEKFATPTLLNRIKSI